MEKEIAMNGFRLLDYLFPILFILMASFGAGYLGGICLYDALFREDASDNRAPNFIFCGGMALVDVILFLITLDKGGFLPAGMILGVSLWGWVKAFTAERTAIQTNHRRSLGYDVERGRSPLVSPEFPKTDVTKGDLLIRGMTAEQIRARDNALKEKQRKKER